MLGGEGCESPERLLSVFAGHYPLRKPSRKQPPVHERLYAYAELNERRRQQRAIELQAELDAELESQRESISWVSRELASGRWAAGRGSVMGQKTKGSIG